MCKDAALCAELHTQIYDLYIQLSVPQTLCSASRESSFLSATGANSGMMLEAFLTQGPLAEVKLCALRVVLGAVTPLISAELCCAVPPREAALCSSSSICTVWDGDTWRYAGDTSLFPCAEGS